MIVLCGDLYAEPGRRGGTGDVSAVLMAFAASYPVVLTVLGNHDYILDPGNPKVFEKFRRQAGIRILDGDIEELPGLRVAGVSGIIGRAGRRLRRGPEAFHQLLLTLAARRPDILLLHDGPDVPGTELVGSPFIRAALEESAPMLTIRGHTRWATPLAELRNGTQVLSVDGRVVVLESGLR